MAKKLKYGWVFNPKSKPDTKPSESLKLSILELAEEILVKWRKTYIWKVPANHKSNYLAELHAKWRGNHFTFGGTYNCPSKTAIFPSFVAGFAKLEYVGGNKFNLAFMRHTGTWWKTEEALSLEKCLDKIRNEEMYHPLAL